MAEYVHTLVASAIAAALFFGGWDGPFGMKEGPGAAAILGPGLHWMVLKTLLLFVSVYWIRWSLLRFRSDQLMWMCWHRLVPLSVVLMAATAAFVVLSG
jgi:NADH-quinone oxidoreductase subunit H